MGRRNLLDDVVHPLLGRERAFDGDQLAIDAEDDRGADLQVNVRSPAIDRRLQNPMKYFHAGQGSAFRQRTKGEKLLARGRDSVLLAARRVGSESRPP